MLTLPRHCRASATPLLLSLRLLLLLLPGGAPSLRTINSCLAPVYSVRGKSILTAEGLPPAATAAATAAATPATAGGPAASSVVVGERGAVLRKGGLRLQAVGLHVQGC